jgi:catechol 2,3-dioxygenase-like lactoylglutathione lyase family enzyme
MTAQLNHTIVYALDKARSAHFLAQILGRPLPIRFGPFDVVQLDNGVSLDFAAAEGPIPPQHYAFLISECDFDGVLRRIREQGLPYWADPRQSRPGEINHRDGGRGVYFPDPDGHFLEVITRPYAQTQPMRDFIFLMHGDRTNAARLDWMPYIAKLQRAGVFEGGSAIGSGECVRKSGPAAAVTGHVTGHLRVKASDLDHAKSLLEGNPVFEAGGTVEIRELPREP